MKHFGWAFLLVAYFTHRAEPVGIDFHPQEVHFDYSNPELWKFQFPRFCAGKRQSPINLLAPKDRDVTTVQKLSPWRLKGFSHARKNDTIAVTGHTVRITPGTEERIPQWTGGGLNGYYRLDQVHFHWGHSRPGSEHTLQGKRQPMEMHMVYIRNDFASVKEATASRDPTALAVMAGFFKVTFKDNPRLRPLIQAVWNLARDPTHPSIQMPKYKLRQLLPRKMREFYRYNGGLTTPTCDEVVAWTVFAKPMDIGWRQMQAFHNVRHPDYNFLDDNFRPTQPLNGRLLIYSTRTSGG